MQADTFHARILRRYARPPVETQCLEDRSSWAWFGAGPAMSSNLMHEWERCKNLSSRVGIGQRSH